MKIAVDYNLCASQGQCELVAPEVFRLDSDGMLQFREDVPEELRDKVELAIGSCPTLAISIQE